MLIGNEMDNLLSSINAIIALGADRNSFGALKRPREGVDARSTAMSVDDSSDEDIPISNLVSLKKRGAQIAQPSATKTTAEAAAPEPKHKNRKLRAEASNASLQSDGMSEGGTPGPQHDADAAGGGPSPVSDSGPNAAGPPIVKTPNDDDASLADFSQAEHEGLPRVHRIPHRGPDGYRWDSVHQSVHGHGAVIGRRPLPSCDEG